eukprot:m.71133 g.71133  ORF g.71133 m.71133 type:complete len:306 (+) comp7920_c0_seq1:1-918(+)
MSYQIACGVSALHELNIVHRDIAARNCLVTPDKHVRVGDVGLGRQMAEDKDYYRLQNQGAPLPLRWMSPECVQTLAFTTASDVWAFGVTMWEMFARSSRPYPDLDDGNVIARLSGRSTLSSNCVMNLQPEWPAKLREVMALCLRWAVAERYTAKQAAQALNPLQWNALLYAEERLLEASEQSLRAAAAISGNDGGYSSALTGVETNSSSGYDSALTGTDLEENSDGYSSALTSGATAMDSSDHRSALTGADSGSYSTALTAGAGSSRSLSFSLQPIRRSVPSALEAWGEHDGDDDDDRAMGDTQV